MLAVREILVKLGQSSAKISVINPYFFISATLSEKLTLVMEVHLLNH
ncbi:hypothetical protein MNBD_GAMMA06-1619 [hydrothermal vent metagenome]|uniref:Uncharacterized protein n=1 Tax=hydrothermal vent metagenome TaxID=652676 RepID=A0A3B0WET0_9ZZZZ